MKHFLKPALALVAIVFSTLFIYSCSSGSGGTPATFGLPKVEMKCNGNACVQ